MRPAYVLLSGAKCNLGDFLITERAQALLAELRPDRELRVAPAWEPLDPSGSLLRGAKAIVIAGGPGYQPRMFPDVYPLTRRLADLPCPVIPLGLGWKGRAGDRYALDTYRFTRATLEALRWMAGRTAWLGCRDRLTQEVLRRHGLSQVAMVGCPVWYDLECLGVELNPPQGIDRIVFTPAQGGALHDQSLRVAGRVAELFPGAERIASFHRGLTRVGRWLSGEDVARSQQLASRLDALGFEVADVTGDTSKIGFYEDCALHVGYRVHAHLWFLSRRKPSLLIEEDGRGAGASQALGVRGVAAYRSDPWGQRLRRALPAPLLQRLPSVPEPYCVDPATPEAVASLLREDLATGFKRYRGVGRVLDRSFDRMREFVRALP